MGEVYRARDPRLRRDVAVKVLPVSAAADADRLRRFDQEACAAAALNHPNILTVHEIGISEGRPYVVSELLEGETLRSLIERGPLSSGTACDYAIQVLGGLAAAHERGIVHRDLKPENLFITADGRVKILDFGLAKLLQPPDALGVPVTSTHLADTSPGMVMGTIGYMSPEQVRGGAIDQRSDLFSFGTILHELTSGQRPFAGDSAADVMSAILHAEPPKLSALTDGRVSPSLGRIIARCLAKEPARRFQSARDLAFALETVAADPGQTAAEVLVHRSRRRPVAVAAMGLLILAVGTALWFALRPRDEPSRSVQQVVRLTHDPGLAEWPTWGPDGRMFAFASSRGGNFDIYLSSIGSGQEAVNITRHPSENVQPAFSPDGASIAFVSTRSSRRQLTKMGTYSGLGYRSFGGDIWVTPILGGQARRLAPDGNYPAWSPDGRTIAYVSGTESQRTILTVPVEGGSPRPLLSSDLSRWEIVRIAYAPGGRRMTFETSDATVFVMPAEGGMPTQLLRGIGHTWAASAHRMYYLQAGAVASRIEAADIRESGERLTVSKVSVIGTNTRPLQHLALAPDGQRLLVSDVEESLTLTRVPLAADGSALAGPEETLGTGQVRDRYPAVSPTDSRRILFASNRFGLRELWTIDAESRQLQRVELPRGSAEGVTGCWLRDGRHVVVMTLAEKMTSLWRVALDGSAMDQIVAPGASGPAVIAGSFACAASPDGRTLLYQRQVGEFTQLMVLDLPSGREQQLTRSPSQKYDATWSPDGRWVAFATNSGGGINIWRIAVGGGTEEPLTEGVDRIRHCFYSPDSRWLYFQPNHRNIYRIPAGGGSREPVTRFPDTSSLFIEEPTITPDGRHLVYARDRSSASLWMFSLSGR